MTEYVANFEFENQQFDLDTEIGTPAIGNGKLSLYDINGNLLGEFSANQFTNTNVIVSGGGGGGIPNVDGGSASSVYTIDQVIDGGNAGNTVGDI